MFTDWIKLYKTDLVYFCDTVTFNGKQDSLNFQSFVFSQSSQHPKVCFDLPASSSVEEPTWNTTLSLTDRSSDGRCIECALNSLKSFVDLIKVKRAEFITKGISIGCF